MKSLRPLDWGFIFVAFALTSLPAILNFYRSASPSNEYLALASAFLKGQISLPSLASYDDMVNFNGQYYLPHPPFPAIVLLPFVAFSGIDHVNVGLIAVTISLISLRIFYNILLKIDTNPRHVPWILAGVFFGTSYWYSLCQSHSIYFLGHIISFCLQVLAINELLTRKRGWLIGIYLACSFLTRQFTLCYLIFTVIFLVWEARKKGNALPIKNIAWMCGTFGVGLITYLAYNYARFGNGFDTGYSYILFNDVLNERVQRYGVFSARYIAFNAYSFFLKGFNIIFTGPGSLYIQGMDPWGTSIFCASPFVLVAFKAAWDRILKVGAWITIGIILIGFLFYHNNGFAQVNSMRFTLDFLPLLALLIAKGAEKVPGWLLKSLIIYAILLNTIALFIYYTTN